MSPTPSNLANVRPNTKNVADDGGITWGANNSDPQKAEIYVSNRLSLRELRVLRALENHRTLTGAADQMNVTPTAISKTLAGVESAIGSAVFTRGARGMRCTELGRVLINLCSSVDAQMQRTGAEIANLARGSKGELHIGIPNTSVTADLIDTIACMKAESPLLRISLHTMAPAMQFENLRNGRLDLAIAQTAVDESGDLESFSLGHAGDAVAISCTHPLAKVRSIGWDTLNEQAWIWAMPGTNERAHCERLWQEMGLPLPRNVVQSDNLMLTYDLLRRMPLVAILPLHFAKTAARIGIVNLLQTPIDLGMGELHAWHVRGVNNNLIMRFKSMLQDKAHRVDRSQAEASVSTF